MVSSFDRSALPRELRPFVDDEGRLVQWPAKRLIQKQALALLASRLEPGRDYRERDFNEALNRWHLFGDWALLRRELVETHFVDRESDGSLYRLGPAPPWGLSDE